MKMSELKNKKNSRAGHKSYLSYTFSEVDKCLKDYTEDIKNEIEQWKEAFQEQLEKVTTLSDQILTLIKVDDDSTEEYMSTEVHDTNKLRFEVKLQLSTIGKLLATNLPNEPLPLSPASPRNCRASSPRVIHPNCSRSGKIAETWSSEVWGQHWWVAGVLGLLWERNWQKFDFGRHQQIFVVARPSGCVSTVCDNWICPYVSKL